MLFSPSEITKYRHHILLLGTPRRSDKICRPGIGDVGPLFEDYLLRGQIWVHTYFPIDWLKYDEVDSKERSIEHASAVRWRAERVLCLVYHLALVSSFPFTFVASHNSKAAR